MAQLSVAQEISISTHLKPLLALIFVRVVDSGNIYIHTSKRFKPLGNDAVTRVTSGKCIPFL